MPEKTKIKVSKAISAIARQNGVSKKEVFTEIQLAIDTAMANPNPTVRAQWELIPHKGEKLTPEDVIAHIVCNMGQLK